MTRVALAVAVSVVAAGAFAGCGDDGRPPTVVRVSVAAGGLVDRAATGVVVGDGRVLTVAHVLEGGAHRVEVGSRRGRVLRVDRRLDLALVAVPGLHAPDVRLASDGDRGRLGVLRDGRAQDVAVTVRRRVTAAVRTGGAATPQDRPALELAADVLPGDSGAPVSDGDGRLLGVVFAGGAGAAGTAWAVDASAVRSLLADRR